MNLFAYDIKSWELLEEGTAPIKKYLIIYIYIIRCSYNRENFLLGKLKPGDVCVTDRIIEWISVCSRCFYIIILEYQVFFGLYK